MEKVLITGGAGYIGSHVVKQIIQDNKYETVVIDNLSTGSQKTIETLKKIGDFEFIKLDLSSFNEVENLFKTHKFDTIIHFAASIVVPESIKNPLKYYKNNTINTINLIDLSVKYKINKFIFSSTAAVYGEAKNISNNGLNEKSANLPINPYGSSKLMSEKVLKDASKTSLLKYVIFRYFNVAGADMHYEKDQISPRIGQSFPDATHLIKIASECAAKKREKMYIFGDDYPTEDGTCIRDYIHVDDLATAHIQAIEYLNKNDSEIFNCGYGKGFSVKEVINTVKKVTGCNFKVEIAKRRDGDPAILISDNTKIKEMMKWKPKYNDIDLICKSAFEWERRL